METYLSFCHIASGSSFFGKIDKGQFAELMMRVIRRWVVCQNRDTKRIRIEMRSKFTVPHGAIASGVKDT
jgi:hypothetical protein